MAVSSIVARGFGSFGGVSLVPTRGYSIAEADDDAAIVLLDLPWRDDTLLSLPWEADEAQVLSLPWRNETTLTIDWRATVPYTKNLGFGAGETVRIDCAPTSDNTNDDVTGWTLAHYVYTRRNGTLLLTKTLGSGITLTSATEGAFRTVLTAANTTALGAQGSKFWHELWRTDSGSEAELANGFLLVRP